MIPSISKRAVGFFVYLMLFGLTCAQQAAAEIQVSYRFNLSNFFGPIPSMWAKLAVDPGKKEIYMLDPGTNNIHIFNHFGMETFAFGDSFQGAQALDVNENGDIFLLVRQYQSTVVKLCNYRGIEIGEITYKNLPELHANFTADRLVYRRQSLYLLNTQSLEVLITDTRGEFKQMHWLKPLLKKQEDPKSKRSKQKKQGEDDLNISGFTVDDQGNMYFTFPMLFSAYKLSTEGVLTGFGGPGSVPGDFGIASGIAVDALGNIFVADRLRSVVSVFDKDFNYLTEFGWRGSRPSNLIAPDSVALDGNGNIYVSQAANRGVSVFKITYQ